MWILIAVIGFALAYVAATYNAFVSLRNRARGAWADIDVQLKRRHDLVPNLVETVKGYASHEKSVFEDVARLRGQAMSAGQAEQRAGAEADFSQAIKSLFAVAESYPELKADKNFRDLQTQLTEVEDHLQYARRYYNAVVRDFNTKREVFPSNLVGGAFGFQQMPYFQVDEDERSAVHVSTGGTQS
jgi:LemA protein